MFNVAWCIVPCYSVFVSYKSVGVGRRFRHAITVVSTDVFRGVCDAGQYSWLRMVSRASMVPGALADGVGIHFVDLFVSSPHAE